jgi:multiple sugar transport system substrate-binding protein
MEIIPNTEHLTKMLAAVAGGTAPDMYDMNDTNIGPLVAKGALAPLDPVAVGFKDQKELDAAYVPGSLNAFKDAAGKIYAIPFEYNSWPLLINDKMFKDIGLDPTKDYPKTWDEVGTIGAKLAIVKDGKFERQGFYWNLLTAGWTMLQYGPLVYQLGGSILSDDDKGNECVINSEAGVRALQTMKDMLYKYKVGAPGINISTGTEAFLDFIKEKAAMTHCAPWAMSQLNGTAVEKDYRVVPLPQFADGKRKVVSTSAWAWVVNAKSAVAAEAWKLVDYASKQGERWLPTAGYVLPRLGWTETQAAKNFKYLDVFIGQFAYGRPRLMHPNASEINAILHKAAENAVWSNQDPKTLLDAAAKEINAILKK